MSHIACTSSTLPIRFYRYWTTELPALRPIAQLSFYCLLGKFISRICRCGLLDFLLSEVTTRVLAHVRWLINSKKGLFEIETFQLDYIPHIWSKTMEAVTDPYAVEKIAE